MRNDYAKERKIKEMYLSGMTTQQIADEYGVAYQTIVYFLKKNGVERRGIKKYHYKEISKMIDDYQNGMTLKAVGEKYDVPLTSMQTLSYKYNFARKPRF